MKDKDKKLDRNKKIEQFVSTKLMEAGVPCHIKGFSYLKKAILLANEDPSIMHNVTKELYPSIASEFNTTPSRVERAIRHAIEKAWDGFHYDGLMEILGPGVTENKMTNAEFVATFVERVKTDMMPTRRIIAHKKVG